MASTKHVSRATSEQPAITFMQHEELKNAVVQHQTTKNVAHASGDIRVCNGIEAHKTIEGKRTTHRQLE